MKKTALLFALSLLTLDTSFASERSVASPLDLTGSRLGKAKYGLSHKGPNQPAVRLFLDKSEGEEDTYYGILFEYSSIPAIAPQYLAARNFPFINELIGYLKSIAQRISVHKVVPGQKPGTFEMHPLRAADGRIEMSREANPLILALDDEVRLDDPLGGAKITRPGSKDVNISFPKDDGFPHGIEYDLAKLVYSGAKLESTWRKKFLRGPYLAAYGKLDDEVLKLSGDTDGDVSTFEINQKFQNLPKKKREKIFTNPKSAFLEGSYRATEPVDGMFLLSPVPNGGQKGLEHVVGRIGLFIDIFDATKSLNQDVVELAFVNPEDPTDFLMYYEHPDNGEGGR